jgi:uncharacterized membrane protein YkoI
MKISKDINQTKAMAVKNRVEKAVSEMVKFDNIDKVDLNSKTGEVSISLEEMKKLGQKGIVLPNLLNKDYKYEYEVQEGNVSFDPTTKEVKNGNVQFEEILNTSCGKGGGDIIHTGIEEKNGKIIYKEKIDDWWNTNNKLNIVEVDKSTGEITKFKEKEYAMSFGDALKEMFTTIPGIGLLTLAGCFGSQGGPVGAAVFAATAAAALAYYKTKAW